MRRDLRGFMQQDEDLFPEKLRKALPPKPYLGVRVADAYIDNVRRFMGMLRCVAARPPLRLARMAVHRTLAALVRAQSARGDEVA